MAGSALSLVQLCPATPAGQDGSCSALCSHPEYIAEDSTFRTGATVSVSACEVKSKVKNELGSVQGDTKRMESGKSL